MSDPENLGLVALLAFDTVVREGEGFLVVPGCSPSQLSSDRAKEKKGCL
jgi:hypothetical protein